MLPEVVAMMLQREIQFAPPSLGRGTADEVQNILIFTVEVLIVWYLGQRILGTFLIRRSTAFCPRCFDTRIRRYPHEGWRMLLPFLPVFECAECGQRFFRGRKPPFANCPECSCTELHAIPPNRQSKGLRSTIRAFWGARGYQCPLCQCRFFDSRPLRPSE